MKLSVHLVSWNGNKYVPYLFDSLRNQTYKNWMFLIVDNNSRDGMVEVMKKELENFPVEYKLIRNKENLGFAPGHNQAFRETDSEYFLLLNQDMYLETDCLEKMVKFLDTHPEAAAVSPRLMKWNFNVIPAKAGIQSQRNGDLDSRLRGNDKLIEGLKVSFTNKIDALGLKVFRNRRVVEWMTQAEWPLHDVGNADPRSLQQNNGIFEVFGVSGAFPMYRHIAINDVLLSGGQMLDESYHSYKEDVDLAYRLASRGFKAYVLLDTVAYHDRAGAGPKEMGDAAAAKNKKKQSEWVRYHSYKNHLMTLYKNEYWQNLILDFPWILWYEIRKFVYFVLFDRKALKGLGEVWRTRKDLKIKRLKIKNLRFVSWRSMRRWWI